jgi:hypothetical protein
LNSANYGVDKVLNVSNEQLKTFSQSLRRCNQTSGRKKEATKLVVLSLYNRQFVFSTIGCRFTWYFGLTLDSTTTPFQVKERLFKQSIQHNRNYYRC